AVATPEIAADGEDVNAAKIAALKEQKAALGQQITAEQKNAAAERDRLTALVASTQQQIAALRSQIDIQRQRVDLSETLVSAARELLAKGYMSAVETKRREDATLEHRQTLSSLQRQVSEQQGKLAEAQYS